jgi:hypothetical protein
MAQQFNEVATSEQGEFMVKFNVFALAAVAGICLAAAAPTAKAQVVVSVGVAPACPYGYYDYSPYSCAPYGYYGPEWFNSGVFIGAGPWFHGDEHFNGHVNNRYDPQHGYKGALPKNGEKGRSNPTPRNFKSNETRDGRGHVAEPKR